MVRKALFTVALILLGSSGVHAGTFLVEPPFISFAISEDSIVHPFLYLGSGGERVVRVCIIPTSDFIDQITPGLLRAIDTFNALEATTENFVLTSKEVPSSELDFESFAIHELLHCAAGIGHSNALAGTAPADLSTNSLVGDDGAFNINPGGDTFFGTFDDDRGDDINTFWFRLSTNDPFVLAPTIDSTTYSRDLRELPAGHMFPANGNFDSAIREGFPSLQPLMTRTGFSGTENRRLAPDDAVNIRYGMSGLNEVIDVIDDYTIRLDFVGVTEDNCDVRVRFDPANPITFSGCNADAILIGASSTHFRLAGIADILFNSDKNWYFGRDIFADGFESGDTFSWSFMVPP
jgi:hypothetical protein